MPEVWAAFPELDAAMQERLAGILETRGADPQQREMRQIFLADAFLPTNAHVLEVGCGTGVLTRTLALWPDVGKVIGVNTAPSLLSKARGLAADIPNPTFREADARSLPFEDEAFDVVVFHTTLTHVSDPERALAEAFRVLRPQGWWVAVFDGDYETGTVALSDHDLLQACVDVMVEHLHARPLARTAPARARPRLRLRDRTLSRLPLRRDYRDRVHAEHYRPGHRHFACLWSLRGGDGGRAESRSA